MARSRSTVAAALLFFAVGCLLWQAIAFVPSPSTLAAQRNPVQQTIESAKAVSVSTFLAAGVATPAWAVPEEDDGFDGRIIAVLFFPLVAASWALFNVWRVAARQVVRFSDSASGSSKIGLRPED